MTNDRIGDALLCSRCGSTMRRNEPCEHCNRLAEEAMAKLRPMPIERLERWLDENCTHSFYPEWVNGQWFVTLTNGARLVAQKEHRSLDAAITAALDAAGAE